MYKNIIAIPYRNRKSHLEYFLNHTVPLIEKNMPKTKVVIVEQYESKLFNRGKVLNVAFKEYYDKTEYFITNDVDINPTNLCVEEYYSREVDNEEVMGIYTSLYDTLGGVIKIKSTTFNKVNGFPNNFWGWGVEDKALQNRCEYFKIKKITNFTDKKNEPLYFKIFNDIDDRVRDKKHYGQRDEEEYRQFHGKSNENKEKIIMDSGLNTIQYKILERKELHKIVELIKVEV